MPDKLSLNKMADTVELVLLSRRISCQVSGGNVDRETGVITMVARVPVSTRADDLVPAVPEIQASLHAREGGVRVTRCDHGALALEVQL